ncbi:MAG: DUF6754 domain-containing protein [candidate division WOR-3 bacterium]
MIVLLEVLALAAPSGIRGLTCVGDTTAGLMVMWNRSPGAQFYDIYLVDSSGEKVYLATTSQEYNRYKHFDVKPGKTYTFIISAVRGEETAESAPCSITFRPAWFDFTRLNNLIFLLAFSLVFFAYLFAARGGVTMTIRKIAGLEELDNAVGRATELGRPILFIHGLSTISELPTVAALTVLKHIGRKAADYETKLLVPNNDPLVMAASQEVVKEAYTEAGRPDLYNEDDIFFVSPEQFAYAAAVNGVAIREKAGAVFLLGYFYAESLMFAEVGQSVGAIQVAGTSATDQLPFFVASCDYTLIGEELYAASAYLSDDALQIATIKAEDIFKLITVILIAVGSVAETIGWKFIFDLLMT